MSFASRTFRSGYRSKADVAMPAPTPPIKPVPATLRLLLVQHLVWAVSTNTSHIITLDGRRVMAVR